VFINFIPIVDITQIKTDIFLNIYNKAVKINNILYAPPSYLKISLYQELSRPLGDLSRWTKIYKRLELLNKFQDFINDWPLNVKIFLNSIIKHFNI
jgi:hypothetical protein